MTLPTMTPLSLQTLLRSSRFEIDFPTLREHQALAFNALRAPGRLVFQAPTGSGKSAVMRALAYVAVMEQRQVILAAPTDAITAQFAHAISRETGRLRFGVDKGQVSASVPGQSLILTLHATFWRRVATGKYSRDALILSDEVHHANYRDEEENRNLEALRTFADVKGGSASPWTRLCLRAFRRAALYRLADARRDGYAARFAIHDHIPDPRQALGRCLWFCPSVAAAEQALAEHGPGVGIVVGQDPPHARGRSARCLLAFRRGELHRLLAVNCLQEGFDSDAETVVIDRAVNSPIMALQMGGRLRPGDGRAIYCTPEARDALDEGLALADGARVECRTCGSGEHLTCHHAPP